MAETSLSRTPVSQKIASLRERQTVEPFASMFSFVDENASWMLGQSSDYASVDKIVSPEILER